MGKRLSIRNFGSLPNIITIGRLLLVPVIVSMIVAGEWREAFFVFLLAGVSDAADGWLAKTFDLRTELGAFLDPLADKALLMSISGSRSPFPPRSRSSSSRVTS